MFAARQLFVALTLAAACGRTPVCAADAANADEPPRTARELYNEGTQKLRDGKLEEAQTLLHAAAVKNETAVLPDAVFNLGHARFEAGDRELKKLIAGGPQLRDTAERAVRSAQDATEAARAALQSGDNDAMVQAYIRGAGARRQMREAAKAVTAAMEQFRQVLTSWEHASADFHSVAEMNPRDTDAARNADIVDRRIAELIDQLKQQQMAMMTAGRAGQELKGAMKEIRGRLPADRLGQLPGPADDEDDDEDQEGQGKFGDDGSKHNGRQPISQEEAAKLLQGVQLDSHRTLQPNPQPRGVRPVKREGGDW